jgi:methyl-accepting chemotaxis protein
MVEETARVSLMNQAELGADIVSLELRGRLGALQELADSESIRSMDWEQQQASLLAGVDRLGYLDLAIVNIQGEAHYVKEGAVSDLAERDYIAKSLHGGQAVSDVLISRVINKPVVMYAVPITDNNGMVAGALIGRRDGTALNDVTKNVRLGSSGYSYMTNKDGVVISHKNVDLVLSQYKPIEEAAKDPSIQSLAEVIRLSQREQMDAVRYTFEGREMAVGFVPVPDSEWTLFVTIDRKELLSGIDHMVILIVSFGAAFIGAGLIAAYLLGHSISRPIGSLSLALKVIAEEEGDLTREISIVSKDEMGGLARYFNLTIAKIKALVIAIKRDTDALSQTGVALAADMVQTASSIDQIAAVIRSITSRIGSQQESVKETGALMEDVVNNIDTLNSQIQRQADCVSQSSSAVEEMLANIQSVTQSVVNNSKNAASLAQSSEAGRNGLQEVSGDIKEIALDSDGLMEINAVMQNIASQTNLLAMNAAIEAAHAGEAGRGFAVVADEIRKLAESSGKQSKTISGMLKKIKDSIDRIAKSTEGVLLKFEAIREGVRQVAEQEENVKAAMEEQGAGSRQVLDAMSDLQEVTHVIRSGAGAMKERSRKVIEKSHGLERITSEIGEGIREIASGAEQIDGAVNHVNDISGENKRQIEALMGEVSKFKVE